MNQVAVSAEEQPRWRRIVDFPLVAMVIAILLYGFAATLAVLVLKALPTTRGSVSPAAEALVFVGLGWFTYKVAIRHLGERLHDDLPMRGALKNLGLGVLGGAVLFSAIVGLAALTDVYNIVGSGSTSDLVTDLFGSGIMAGFMEELLFRGILFRWIEEFGGSWAGLVLSSLGFGFAHYFNPGSTVLSCLWIAAEAGVLLGGAYMLTRSLWMPMGLHAAWNFTQGFIYDVPVSGVDEHGLVEAKLSGPALLSGGQFGLEASIFALVIGTSAGVWLVALAVRRGELVQPRWVRRRRINFA